MLRHTTIIRIRYGEVDAMAYVYHGYYPYYLDQARTELLRAVELPYSFIESKGYIFPVYNLSIQYHKPLIYDELIAVECWIKKLPESSFEIDYEIKNEKKEKCASATTTLVVLKKHNLKICRTPAFIINKLKNYF